MTTRAIAVLGTASDVGKSMIAAGLCRLFARRGLDVAPFKAQNMSLNSFVTLDGGEIGRAQAVQAHACGLEPTVDMNPILLKPESDTRSQVIVQGHAVHALEAAHYYERQAPLWTSVTESYRRLADSHDLMVIEGAGSAAEVNLRDRDLANWRMVEHADAKVVLVADIDRGGVFAQVIGTLDLLAPQERARVLGIVINKFRGDRSLFEDGVRFLGTKTGLPILGVVPFLRDCHVEQEDAVPAEARNAPTFAASTVNIAILLLPRMSNFTDFQSLSVEPDVALRYVRSPNDLAEADVVIVPGTKNTIADLSYLAKQDFLQALARHVKQGGELVGICGGYQMLGTSLSDPDRIEQGGEAAGLGYLEVTTAWRAPKLCRQVEGIALGLPGLHHLRVRGYEIHHGRISGSRSVPCFAIRARLSSHHGTSSVAPVEQEGAVGYDGRVWGTSIHGVFDAPEFRRVWLNRIRGRKHLNALPVSGSHAVSSALEHSLARWADHLEQHLDMSTLEQSVHSVVAS